MPLSGKNANGDVVYLQTTSGSGTVDDPYVVSHALTNWPTLQNVALPTTERVPTLTVATTSGTISAGCRSITFAHSGASGPTIAGAALPAGVKISLEAPGNDTLAAVTYDPGASSTLIILELR